MSEIAFPGASTTYGSGINDANDLVGYYSLSGVTHGFYRDESGFHTADVSGASATYYEGMNNNGLMVGYYTSGGVDHGMLALIPEPTTMSLLGVGALLLCRRGRRQARIAR